jgi:hypothetical protein
MITLIWNPPSTWHIREWGTWRTALCGREMPKRGHLKKVAKLTGLTICLDCQRIAKAQDDKR